MIASSNQHKIEEFRQILLPYDYQVRSPADLGIAREVEETGATFIENATLKAEAYRVRAGMMVLADDSGLEVAALGGEPGITSARYGGPGLSDADRVHLVLRRLEDVPAEERSARFIAAIAVAAPGEVTRTFVAVAEGVITLVPIGEGGFGYDPIFLFPPLEKTFAELPSYDKARVSHRGKAARAAVSYLRSRVETSILDKNTAE